MFMKLTKEFFKELQNKPYHTRKIIFWSILIILSIVMGFWWIKTTQKRFSQIQNPEYFQRLKQSLQFPEIKIPEIELPDLESITTTTTPINVQEIQATTTE